MKIEEMIDVVFSHNSLIKIWVNAGASYKELVWKGVAWKLPENYRQKHGLIFGSIQDKLSESDYIQIEIKEASNGSR